MQRGSSSNLFVLGRDFRLDIHVAEFTRFEDLAALHALDVFRVFLSSDNLDTEMPTRLVHRFARREIWSSVARLAKVHEFRPDCKGIGAIFRYFRPEPTVVKLFQQTKC